MKRIAVTGAAGFIGSHLCEALLDLGHEVSGVDNFDSYYDRSIKERWLAPLADRAFFRFLEADICVNDTWLNGVETVIHLAARPGVRASVKDPERYVAVNIGGTAAVLEACRSEGVNQVIVGSSSSVYGERGDVALKETDKGLEPASPYGVTKRAAELLAQVYAGVHDMRIVALRFFSVYGSRQRPDQALSCFLRLLKSGQPVECFGDGLTGRDYTHVDDVVRGVLGAVSWIGSCDPGFEIVNIGSSEPVRLRDVIDSLALHLGATPDIRIMPRPEVDVTNTRADIEKARAMFEYEPQVAFDDGIARFIQWHEATYGH